MKKYSILLMICFGSCRSASNKDIIHDTIKIIDSIYYTDQPKGERYLLVAYDTRYRNSSENGIEGNHWFSFTGNFPSKQQIDSLIFKDLPKKCLQNIIIKSIYEFKDADDFYSFTSKTKENYHFKPKHCE